MGAGVNRRSRRRSRRRGFLLLQQDGDVTSGDGTCTCTPPTEDETGVVGRPLSPGSVAGINRRHGLLMMLLSKDGKLTRVTARSKSTYFGVPAPSKIQLLNDNAPVTHSASTSSVLIAGVAMIVAGAVALIAAVFVNKRNAPKQSESAIPALPMVAVL